MKNNKFLSTIILSGVFFGILACDEKRQPKLKETKNVKEIVAIDTLPDSLNESGVIASVYTATADTSGNMYLVDQRSQQIHSFDEAGDYRWTVGGEGPGPGEFMGISDIVASDSLLYVHDRQKAMMVSYDFAGHMVDEWEFHSTGSGFKQMREMPDGRFIFPHWDPESETLIDIYSTNFKEKEESLIHPEEVHQTEKTEVENEILQLKLGSAYSLGEDRLIYVPRHYNGELIIFEKNAKDSWERAGTIEGFKEINPSITIHETEDGSHDRSLLSGYNPQGGFYNIEFHSMSYGLYPYEDNAIVHLSYYAINESDWQLVIEKFDIDTQELNDYFAVDNIEIPSYQPNELPLWFDKDGCLYLRDHSGDPTLRKYKVSF